MKKLIATKRLILREFDLSDAQSLYELNANPDVLKYTGDHPFASIQEAVSFLDNYYDYSVNGYGRWAVICKESDEFLGWCGLKLNEEEMIDLGFRFFQEYWGKGYATEAAEAALGYGFSQLNMHEIIGRASIENVASIKVLEKIGMRFWKYDRCEGINNAAYYRINKKNYGDIKNQ